MRPLRSRPVPEQSGPPAHTPRGRRAQAAERIVLTVRPAGIYPSIFPHTHMTASSTPPDSSRFIAYSEEFREVTGPEPRFYTVIETDAHEGPVYVASENALYFTTVPAPSGGPIPDSNRVAIKRVALDGGTYPLPPSALTKVRE